MAPMLLASHLLKTIMHQGTTRVFSLRTALLHVPLTFASCMFCLVGKGPHITNSTLFNDAHQNDFYIPSGKYYLTDAGFASLDPLLVPY